MQQKAFTLQNRGMNRDLSVSKAGESSAYENHNIRIMARDHDTTLSVTNERGTKKIDLGETGIQGNLIGWNVLNNHLILFTTEDTVDRIYRLDYDGEGFKMMKGSAEYGGPLYQGRLGFSEEYPIESVVYHETDDIQKIYWVDGIHSLRFMNFMADEDEMAKWDDTYFDSNRVISFGVGVQIHKDNSGNTRANGTVQYLLTYYNKHGQESGYAWISDLIYLSPVGVGGAVDGTNSNRITLSISNLDRTFTNFRVYSILRTSLNGQTRAYLVYDGDVTGEPVTVIDDGAHLTAVDSNSLLYLGSQPVHPGTLTHKDETLFLGDLQSVGNRGTYDFIEEQIKANMFEDNGWESSCIEFEYATSNSIPYTNSETVYSYENQLIYSSSEITSFKGGEKYRFALVFRLKDGTTTDAFWIGDKVNDKYPEIDTDNHLIRRIVAKCSIPQQMIQYFRRVDIDFQTIQLMIAEATYADRSVKAQGIVNPTVFNVWERYTKGIYASSSWLSRPRGSKYAWQHFTPIHSSINPTGEIDCNYWNTETDPVPFYQLDNFDTTPEYVGDFDGQEDFGYLMVVIGVVFSDMKYKTHITVIKAKVYGDANALLTWTLDDSLLSSLEVENTYFKLTDETDDYLLKYYQEKEFAWSYNGKRSRETAQDVINRLVNTFGVPASKLTTLEDTLTSWLETAKTSHRRKDRFYNINISGEYYMHADYENEAVSCINRDAVPSGLSARWIPLFNTVSESGEVDFKPSYYKKHLMFVDENIVTLNSPELEYNALSFDNATGYKFRIVGIAELTTGFSDYTVDATPGKLPGENLVKGEQATWESSSADGILSWPLWSEYGLELRDKDEDGEEFVHPEDPEDYTSKDYRWGTASVRYWLHMWNHSGKINGFTDEDEGDFSNLHRKTFANLRYSPKTVYNNYKVNECVYDNLESVRIFNYTGSQSMSIKVNGETKHYEGSLATSLSVPGNHKYPILYTDGIISSENLTGKSYLFSATPVSLEYSSSPHAIISLGSTVENNVYRQNILPWVHTSEAVSPSSASSSRTGWIIPWETNTNNSSVPNIYYDVNQPEFISTEGAGGEGSKYLFIGEIYYDFDSAPSDSRYGGTSAAAVKNCRFIPAGPQYPIASTTIYANQGDTYIQRWDCMKTKPYSTGSVNNVIDITSVMLETHINIDGQSDLQRRTRYIASIDPEKYTDINLAYSQTNNFVAKRDLDEDFNVDTYRSSITWTMPKTDSAPVDEWSHITLANTLKLDGDKGCCQALRRFQNSIIAFQDRGIAEVLFNSRTQLSTTDGVPVEIANSGKVDGKRYITNKFGCLNKWSITEGKSALYFVDNINKAFCSFGGQGVEALSTRLGFDVWFRDANWMKPWNPKDFKNIVSFYDRVHSDIYLVRGTDDEMSCLVYNEKLGAFSSFFDYGHVPMMTNIENRFVSYRNGLWFQNEGLYGNFFGEQKDFWVQYRVTPDPFGDKIWSGFDYRADFYHILNENGESVVPEEYIINGDKYGQIDNLYLENETFDSFRIWNEYQSTGVVDMFRHNSMDKPAAKDFRIWRRQIPRAMKLGTNKHGLDRIRNQWINIRLDKSLNGDENQNLMQLHDIVVRYFE